MHPIVEEYCLLERTYYPPTRPKNSLLRRLKTVGLLLANLTKNPFVLLQLFNVAQFGQEAREQRLFYKAISFLDRKSYDIIHCQFGIFGIMGLAFRQMGLIEGKLTTGFRGYDISKYLPKRGARIYDELFKQGDFFVTNTVCQRPLHQLLPNYL